MKFNLLSGILIILLIISLVFAFFQKTEADAARLMAEQNEAKALVLKAEADAATAEARRQAQIAMEEVQRCMESKK
jgi:Tfp pilus assembly protein PilO